MPDKIVIKKYPASGPIIVAGMEFENIDAIKSLLNIWVNADKADDAKQGKRIIFSCNKEPKYREGWCVALIYERFPCFDSEDYATENRYYRNYIFHKGRIEPALCKRYLKEIPMGCNDIMATVNAPAEFLPIVYHADGEQYVTVAELALD